MGQERSGVKVAWEEGQEIHVARAFSYCEETTGFLKFNLFDGRTLLLSRSCILKIEELSQ